MTVTEGRNVLKSKCHFRPFTLSSLKSSTFAEDLRSKRNQNNYLHQKLTNSSIGSPVSADAGGRRAGGAGEDSPLLFEIDSRGGSRDDVPRFVGGAEDERDDEVAAPRLYAVLRVDLLETKSC